MAPTVGRVVSYYPASDEPQYGSYYDEDKPLVALITYELDNAVNLAVFGHDGSAHAVWDVPFRDGGERPYAWVAPKEGSEE